MAARKITPEKVKNSEGRLTSKRQKKERGRPREETTMPQKSREMWRFVLRAGERSGETQRTTQHILRWREECVPLKTYKQILRPGASTILG